MSKQEIHDSHIAAIKSRTGTEFQEWASIKDSEWMGISFEGFLVKKIMQLEADAEDMQLERMEEYPD